MNKNQTAVTLRLKETTAEQIITDLIRAGKYLERYARAVELGYVVDSARDEYVLEVRNTAATLRAICTSLLNSNQSKE